MKKGVSIILTAWKTQDFIEECLDSIQAQTYFTDHDYEILLGIDNCEETLEKVKEIRKKYSNLEVYFFDENVGTYKVSNTLCNLAKYEYLARFDTDDVMLPDMIEKLVNCMEESSSDLVVAKIKNFTTDINGNKHLKDEMMAHGQIFIKKETFDEFGGYRPFTCGADTELRKRIQPFIKCNEVKEVLSYRRMHSTNLTVMNNTNMRSIYRQNILAFTVWELEQINNREDAVIQCITENPRKLYKNNILSEIIEVNPKKHDVSNLYDKWEIMTDSEKAKYKVYKPTKTIINKTSNFSKKEVTNDIYYHGLRRVKACAGYSVFP